MCTESARAPRVALAMAMAMAVLAVLGRAATPAHADQPAPTPAPAGPAPTPPAAVEPTPTPPAVVEPTPTPPAVVEPTPTPTSAPVVTPPPGPTRPAANPARGARLYKQRCAICHGNGGRGDGSIARELEPRPRDLTRGIFKLRSTASGALPTDDDLFRTLTRGIPGTAMFAWSGLPAADRWQLVYHIKSLSPRFARKAAPPLPAPDPPAMTEALRARGELVYQQMMCGECHGPDGRGDGVKARALVDDSRRRTYPFDLTRGWKLKAGSTPADLFRVLHTGLDGTPMPSYADALSEADGWALVAHLRGLFRDGTP
ncbi:MAG: c-type cytochrome [Deltaproteobacteria bacterium]|nr:c-type cytochrome [Deltaproteobacteria bacterium]